MARKPNPDSPYRVTIHTIGKHRYASTQRSSVDPATGMRIYRRVHWGTVDENLRFLPGKAYVLAAPEERSRLIFPEDWDLSEADRLTGPGEIRERQGERFLYGDVWLLEQLAEAEGIRRDLTSALAGNEAMADAVLTLACFLLCDRGVSVRADLWQRVAKTPYPEPLTARHTAEILRGIPEDSRTQLLRLRTARYESRMRYAVDRDGQSVREDDSGYGEIPDPFASSRSPEVTVYASDGFIPVYYKTFPWNHPDPRGLTPVLDDLRQTGFPDFIVITDRGYESLRGIDAYLAAGQPMVMRAGVRQGRVSRRIQALVRGGSPEDGMECDPGTGICFRQYDAGHRIRYPGREGTAQLKLNLYLDPEVRGRELEELDHALLSLEDGLEELRLRRIPLNGYDKAWYADRFYHLTLDPADGTLQEYTLNEEKVAQWRRESGFFANLTYRVSLDPMEALRCCRLLAEQGPYLRTMDERLAAALGQEDPYGSCRTGRRLVLFVAQSLDSLLHRVHREKLSGRYETAADVLDEMRPILYLSHPGMPEAVTRFTGAQADICAAFGFQVPPGCEPEQAGS